MSEFDRLPARGYPDGGHRCISVGTKKGYSITNVEPFGRVYTMSAYGVT